MTRSIVPLSFVVPDVIGTMHLAKGLEFRAVVAKACHDELIPSSNGSNP